MNRFFGNSNQRVGPLLTLTIVLTIVIFGVGSRLLVSWLGINVNYKVFQNERMSGEIRRSDGTVETFEGSEFAPVQLGDELTIYIKEPIENPYNTDVNLCFFGSNSYVTIDCGEEVIYAQDKEPIERGYMPADQFYTVALPEDYIEQGITVRMTPVDRNSVTSLSIWTVPTGHSIKSILSGKENSFLLLVTLLVCSSLLSIMLGLASLIRKQLNSTFLLAVFCFFIVLWNIGSQGFLYVVSDTYLAPVGEYLALYASCIPLSFYIAKEIHHKFMKKLMYGFAVFFTIFFVYMTILTFSIIPAGYNTYLMWLHAAILLMILAYFVSLYLDRGRERTMSQKISGIGFLLCVSVGLGEFIRFYIVNNYGTSISLFRQSFGPMAISILVLTVIMSAGYSYINDYMEKLEKEHLRILAYQDSLTGIPNRSACYQRLEEIKEQKVPYTILFLDLNFLKKANDYYGHEVGDKMLILTGEAMRTAFEGNGFFGRWGGDEFIACIPGPMETGDAARLAFEQAVQAINERETDLPFGLSIAIGRADSTTDMPIDPIDAINQADDCMYLAKKQMKAVRTE